MLSLVLALGGLVAVSGTAVADDPQVPEPLSLVTGAVTLSDGAPGAAVTVSAEPKAGTTGTTASTSTDATGAYALELGTGTYTITYGLDRYETRKVEDVIVTAARTLDPVELARLYRLSGTVKFTDGTAAVGAGVQAWIELGEEDDYEEVLAGRTTVDADGAFQLDLPAGYYSVTISGKGVPLRTYGRQMDRDRTIVLTNAVRTPSVTGSVQVDDGKDLDTVDAAVYVEQYGDLVDWISPEADGTFEATLPSGTYTFHFTADGYATQSVPVVVSASDRTVDPVVLRRLPHVAGSVTLSDGAALADLDGFVQADRRLSNGTWENEVDLRSIREDGSFVLALEPGTYRLTVQAYGYAKVVLSDVVVTAADRTVAPVALQALPRLSGTVVLADGGSHADAETSVALMTKVAGDWDYDEYTPVETDGSYSIPAASGTYRLLFEAFGYASRTVDVTVTSASQTIPTVTLERQVPVSGRVLSPAGDPVRGAVVDLVEGATIVDRVTTDSLGRWATELARGTYVVRVTAAGFAELEQSLTVTGTTVVPDLTLAAEVTAKVTGTVTFDGSWGTTVSMERRRSNGSYAPPITTWTLSATPFELVVPLGTYRLRYTNPEHVTKVVENVVVDGPRTLAAVRLTALPPALAVVQEPVVSGYVHTDGRATVSAGQFNYRDVKLTYQWYLAGAPLKGATGSSLSLVGVKAGTSVQVAVTASRTNGEVVRVFSDVRKVELKPVTFTGDVKIVGRFAVGETLRAVAGRPSPANAKLTYQWSVHGETVAGATGPTMVLRPEHLGKRVKVIVRAEAPNHQAGVQKLWHRSVVKTGTITVRTAPSVTGKTRVGATLRARPGSYSAAPSKVRYQWLVGGKVVKGATRSTFRPTAAHAGRKVTVRVTVSATGYADRKVVSRPTRSLAR